MDATYRFGIEEEYFLADRETRATPDREAARAFHRAAAAHVEAAGREVLESQIEVSTAPSADFAAARATLAGHRGRLAGIGRAHGLLVFAAGTHPLARWPQQNATEGERYQRMVRDYGMLATRNMVCALHVHVEVPRPESRVDLMNRLVPFVPLLLALSTGSPFWQGRPTGLAGYRMAAYREWPRSGLPPAMDDAADYERYLAVMTASGAIPDATYLWWALRPSMRYPTLELRVTDSCVRLDDAIAITALYRCLVRLLDRRADVNARLTGASRAIAAENLWRAQRDGARAHLIDEAACAAAPVASQLEAVLALVAGDAEELGCGAEVAATRRIVAAGTGADRQTAVYEAARREGADEEAALRAVVDWLAAASAATDERD